MQQPKSQNQKEGLKVEITCNCEMQEKFEVWYQWFKDGAELQGENASTLVLDYVKMRDFGCYRCRVTHTGDESGGVTSDAAVLEVSPCGGMSEYFFCCAVAFAVNQLTNYFVSNRASNSELWRENAVTYKPHATVEFSRDYDPSG